MIQVQHGIILSGSHIRTSFCAYSMSWGLPTQAHECLTPRPVMNLTSHMVDISLAYPSNLTYNQLWQRAYSGRVLNMLTQMWKPRGSPADRSGGGAAEKRGREGTVVQAPLFTLNARGELTQPVADIPALKATSSLDVARWWFRRHLEQLRRPINTIDSYMYDLAIFQSGVGNKTLDRINTTDIANFLGDANNKSTRKRRLTSLQGLFRYLEKE